MGYVGLGIRVRFNGQGETSLGRPALLACDSRRHQRAVGALPEARHTANAFLGAHMAYKEFKDSSPWLAYSGYALAAFVAGSRLYNNRHWVADVLAGAGFGILSVELSYFIYFPIRNAVARLVNKRASDCPIVAAPMFHGDGAGFYLSYRF